MLPAGNGPSFAGFANNIYHTHTPGVVQYSQNTQLSENLMQLQFMQPKPQQIQPQPVFYTNASSLPHASSPQATYGPTQVQPLMQLVSAPDNTHTLDHATSLYVPTQTTCTDNPQQSSSALQHMELDKTTNDMNNPAEEIIKLNAFQEVRQKKKRGHTNSPETERRVKTKLIPQLHNKCQPLATNDNTNSCTPGISTRNVQIEAEK